MKNETDPAPPTGDREIYEPSEDGSVTVRWADHPDQYDPDKANATIIAPDTDLISYGYHANERIKALEADKAASDDVIEALAARIAELEAEADRAHALAHEYGRERDLLIVKVAELEAQVDLARDKVAAERVRGDRLAEMLLRVTDYAPLGHSMMPDNADWIALLREARALAADPEGGRCPSCGSVVKAWTVEPGADPSTACRDPWHAADPEGGSP